ncbi:uncharacterized protein LOC117582505 isoform X2 [Drosophila guanche]|uniref:Uncharacterized protein n=1 Tax=Drosophila guanche TaxID=7266 RepID=A0A3B0JBP7_DROGU|nr:uncharacterized protein LOC117582505 isoform X2 [Drosophila guanche]SPP79465.1 Hypothetical predicted protein [Drosophila guanche]
MQHQHWQSPLHTPRRRWNRTKASSIGSGMAGHEVGGRSLSSRTYHLPALLIILLVLIQNFELHMCRQLMRQPNDKRSKDKLSFQGSAAASAQAAQPEAMAADDKRNAGRSSPSQPEEIFSAPTDDSYDEYPMVVPKRAALLLDRLMVALHHALEQERVGHRIGDFYADKNNLNAKLSEYKNGLEEHHAGDDGINLHMYSDDDPGVMLDYDFKDLNQINRATGETRRAGAESERTGSHAAAGSSPTGSRRIHSSGGGRMYWRCYFNAVSCF